MQNRERWEALVGSTATPTDDGGFELKSLGGYTLQRRLRLIEREPNTFYCDDLGPQFTVAVPSEVKTSNPLELAKRTFVLRLDSFFRELSSTPEEDINRSPGKKKAWAQLSQYLAEATETKTCIQGKGIVDYIDKSDPRTPIIEVSWEMPKSKTGVPEMLTPELGMLFLQNGLRVGDGFTATIALGDGAQTKTLSNLRKA